MLWRSVRLFQAYATEKEGTLTILEPSAIYPINWRAEKNDACKSNNETGTHQTEIDVKAVLDFCSSVEILQRFLEYYRICSVPVT